MDEGIDLIYKKSLSKFTTTLSKKYKIELYSQEVLQKLEKLRPLYVVIKDEYGNFVHPETSLILNEHKKVIGRYKEGIKCDLQKEDIETCKQFKFDYELPFNLDSQELDLDVLVEKVDNILNKIED